MAATTSAAPTRSIRARFDKKTITVYQAYSSKIASAAVAAQRLDASPAFKPGRMTWIKPSWNWMMYRSGYSFKDPNQECILALKLSHEGFAELLGYAKTSEHVGKLRKVGTRAKVLDEAEKSEERAKSMGVVVQWDPERDIRVEKIEGVRSIQIGVPGGLKEKWIREWIVGIEDVTMRARELQKLLDEDPEVNEIKLRELGLLPEEHVYDEMLPEDVRTALGMSIASIDKR